MHVLVLWFLQLESEDGSLSCMRAGRAEQAFVAAVDVCISQPIEDTAAVS